jgi:hypothetical protein
MNYISHLNRFYARLPKETRFTSRHISLYLALFHCWNNHRFESPFTLVRERVMQLSGLRSKDTYMKCLHDLHMTGYIIYSPGLHKYHRPRVSMISLVRLNDNELQLPLFQKNPDDGPGSDRGNQAKTGTCTVPVLDPLTPKTGSVPVPVLGPYNKTIINKENRERETHAQNPPVKTCQENQNSTPRAAVQNPPSLEEVQAHFKQTGFPEREASLFFNHYQANGWKLGGKAPITNWRAAAAKWVQYAKIIETAQHEKPGKYKGTEHLHVRTDKNYDEPL